MLRSYIQILLRNLYKKRIYSFINIAGLAVGIASFIIIMFYVMDELSYDKYHKRADSIHRICMIYDFGGVGENSASLPFPVAFMLKDEFPDAIKNVTRVFNFQSTRNLIEYKEKLFNERGFFFADSTFFEIFDHEFVKGDPETALDEPYAVVITETTARKYFNEEDPIGKTLKFEINTSLKITGVIKDVPTQSHFGFDFIASMASVKQIYGGRLPRTWVWNPCWTYVQLADGADPAKMEKRYPELIKKYFSDAEKASITMYNQKLTDIHLNSRLDYEIEPNSNRKYVVILSVIAIFLLIIAGINFMNLATATASVRAKEIGIRKVTGAYRSQIISQFLGETLVLTFISMVLAIIIVELCLPFFNDFTGKTMDLDLLFSPVYLIALIVLWIIIGVFSGTYPAFYLSAFKPVSVLKGKIRNEIKGGSARKMLVVFQFAISIALIIGTLIVFEQLRYMRAANLGFNPKNVIVLPIDRTEISSNQFESFKKDLLKNANIFNVSAMDDIIGASHNTHEFRPEGVPEDEWRFYPALVIRDDFVKTMKIEIVAGRDYDELFKTDPVNGMLINEAMVKHQGWTNEEAIGKQFRSLQGKEKVIGVFKDFHATSLHEAASPFVLNMKEMPQVVYFFLNYVVIKIGKGDFKETLSHISKTWYDFDQAHPFDYFLLEDALGKLYADEKNLGVLSMIFTLLILFVAGMGLFGLASYMAERKVKEISIRKVMGATVLNIFVLLSKEFVMLIIIAMIIAWPVAYFLIDEYFLNQFIYQVWISPFTFFAAGFFALFIALIITSYRAFTASRTNPAETLNVE